MADDNFYSGMERDRHWDRMQASEFSADHPAEPVRGWGCLSWIVILLVAGFLALLREAPNDKGHKLPPLDDTAESMTGLQELQARGLIGLGEFIRRFQPANQDQIKQLFEGAANNAADQAQHKAMWTHGTLGQRLQFVVVGGELSGPQAALELLGRLNIDLQAEKLELSKDQLSVARALRRLYQDYDKQKFDGPSVKEPQRQQLIAKLGWYGRLALTPPQSPDVVAREVVIRPPFRLMLALLGTVGVVLLLGVVGCMALVLFSIAVAMGMRVGLRPGTSSSGVYAETFALWLTGFTAALLGIQFWPWEETRFVVNLLAMFGSLIVLVWPVLRGIPWSQVRSDLGLTWGRAGILEPLMGIPGYVMMLPMLGVGFAITFLLLIVYLSQAGGGDGPASPFEPQHFVTHPIVNFVLRGDFWLKFQLFTLACVAAPIVEEIMFRGVLYRHLRDATGRLGWVLSCVLSGLWVSFIFAVIHPQGWVAVPALMGIACGCTLTREWRDSLWASMVIHAINNGLVFSMLMMGAMP